VWNGTIRRTSGGLTRADLMKTKDGRIVSRKASMAAKKAVTRKLFDKGYKPEKGMPFKAMHKRRSGKKFW
jgi:hypothetical protein